MVRHSTPESRFFVLCMALAAFWSTCSTLQLVLPDFEAKRFWSDIKFISVTALPVGWFLMASAFAGLRMGRSWWHLAALFVIPVLTVAIVASNPIHGWMFKVQWPAVSDHFTSVGRTYGPWFWIYTTYAYGLIAASVVIFARAAHVRMGNRRVQAWMMLAGSLIPIVLNGFYLASPDSFYQLDFTPVAFSLSGVVFAVGLFRFNMLDLTPIARREIVRSMADPVVVTDARGVIADMNDAAMITLDMDRSAIGTHFRHVLRGLAQAMNRQGSTRAFSAEVSRRIGDDERWFDARATLLVDDHEVPLGYLCVLRDVTERKLAEEQLRVAKQHVEELSRLKSAFLSNMSHEIRTPLAGIIGLAELLAEETEGEHAEFAEMIRDGGSRLLRMLNSVLSVAHLSSGKIEQHTQRVDVNSLLQETLRACRGDAERAGLKLESHLPGVPVEATLDPDHLQHAISHLLDNAIQYTDAGSVIVRLETSGDDVLVMISDTGRGMNREFLNRAAEAFSQEAYDLDRPVEGTGLGLRVAFGLIQEMRGNITVESVKGAGTTLTVTIPRRHHAGLPDKHAVRTDRKPSVRTTTPA